MNELISVCIPTYKRPELLRLTVESCFRQRYRPLQILIGDDWPESNAKHMLDNLSVPDGITIQYQRHAESLRQARNVNWLFANATGDRIVLLHDDDLMTDGGIDILDAAWKLAPTPNSVIYGKQRIINEDGIELDAETANGNEFYYRRPELAGEQKSSITAALLQQLPNNGYLISRKTADEIRYRPEEEIGHSVDADFGIRIALSQNQYKFYYVDQFVSALRLTKSSILRLRINYRHHLFFKFIERLDVPDSRDAQLISLDRIGAEAALDAAMSNERWLALRILASRHYPHRILSRWTVYRCICIASPKLGAGIRNAMISALNWASNARRKANRIMTPHPRQS